MEICLKERLEEEARSFVNQKDISSLKDSVKEKLINDGAVPH